VRHLVRIFAPAIIVGFIVLQHAGIAPAGEIFSAKSHSADAKTAAEDVNTWVIFGFTEGSDVGAAGDRTLFQDAFLRASRSQAGFGALDSTLGIAYSPTDRFVVWAGGIASFESGSRARADADLPSYYAAGITGGVKYQVLNRQESPFGFSVQFSPSWQPIGTGPAEILSGELRGIIDGALILDGWYTALNVVIQPERDTDRRGVSTQSTTVEVSGALTYRLNDNVFLGGELRALKKTDSSRFWDAGTRSLHLGPTLLVQLGTTGYLGISWSTQVASDENPAGGRDLALERHHFRLKSGFSF